MPCSQTLAGIARDCSSNMGGIKEVYIANFADVDSVTVTSGVITAITMASSKKFYKYAFAPNSSNLASNWKVNAENGTKYVESNLTMVFNKMDSPLLMAGVPYLIKPSKAVSNPTFKEVVLSIQTPKTVKISSSDAVGFTGTF